MSMKWEINQKGYRPEDITTEGNRFLIGNGYMGVRGTLEEYTKEQLVAVNLSGIYDKVGDGWREPLNAPNGLYTYIKVDGKEYRLPEEESLSHEISLDFRHGILNRETTWRTSRGNITVRSQRFVSAGNVHRIGMRYQVNANFHADVEIVTGIDYDVWDIHGPHYDEVIRKSESGALFVTGVTHEKKQKVYVSQTINSDFPSEIKEKDADGKFLQRIIFVTDCHVTYSVEKWICVYTDEDGEDAQEALLRETKECTGLSYKLEREAHNAIWEERWKHSEVSITGDDIAEKALNYSLYHLHCIAPRHSGHLSIPARGLSGQTYKGAVFWDTEMFMLDFFLFTEPETAKSLMQYRIDTLPGAITKAKQYGYKGAFYAWESQEGGYDACTDYNVTDVFTGRPMRTFFRDKQYHISAAVVYGIMRYTEITGDYSLLDNGGSEVILQCADFYYDLLLKKVNGSKYEIHDVIGPDEYHERVNNNGYTNRMAKFTFESAGLVIERLENMESGYTKEDLQKLKNQYLDAAENIFIPEPDKEGVIEQFTGYKELEDVSVDDVRSRLLHEKEYWGGAYGVATHTRVIKQADVVTWLNLFPEDFSKDILLKNWQFYEPYTEHGSSLSACMYAMLACRCGMPEKAYPFFIKTASADLSGGGKEWAGLVYIGGTHPAAAGGAYMTAIEGFAGVRFEQGEIKAEPHLPDKWKEMRFRITYLGKEYMIHISENKATVECVHSHAQPNK